MSRDDIWSRVAAQLHEAATAAGQVAADRERTPALTACPDEVQELFAAACSPGSGAGHD